MIILAYLLSFFCLLVNLSLLLKIRPPFGWMLQLAANSFAPVLVIIGALGAILGWLAKAPLAVIAGILGAAISIANIILVTVSQPGFDQAVGGDWRARLPASRLRGMLKRRWNLGWPTTRDPLWERNIAFWTLPGTGRQLLCDVWQPPAGVARNGAGLIYLHGSAWFLLDKDFGTRPFFRHLANQGYVIMDVAYRLCPEVDIFGMIGDVKRAIAWMKANAARYQVDPERVSLIGASAGGHLAMLAAYAPHHPQLTPPEVQDSDLSIRSVVSYYGPADLRAVYAHTHQEENFGNRPKVEIGAPPVDGKPDMANAGRLDTLLGGRLDEIPEVYALASPITHIHPGCPPTLLIQGKPDTYSPVNAVRELHCNLVACGVPAASIVYPMTNHAFDLLLPRLSPTTHAALFYVERFLALMA